ncbi:MAG: HEPN domain-containing protein, partial [Promethearchaeota archaeon]
MIFEKWLEKSRKFKRQAWDSFRKGDFDFACFFSQQAVEFYLKGKLIQKFNMKLYGHSLTDMVGVIIKSGFKIPENVTDCLNGLENHYIQARYPDARV